MCIIEFLSIRGIVCEGNVSADTHIFLPRSGADTGFRKVCLPSLKCVCVWGGGGVDQIRDYIYSFDTYGHPHAVRVWVLS